MSTSGPTSIFSPAFVRRLSLKWKFIAAIVLVAFVVTLLQNALFYLLNVHHATESLENKMAVLAEVLGGNSTSAIQFQSREDAAEVLSALQGEPSVHSAYLFTAEGGVLAEYHPEPNANDPFQTGHLEEGVFLQEDNIVVRRSIFLDGKLIGHLLIAGNLDELRQQIAFSLLIAFVLQISAIVLALLLGLWCQRYFVAPIVKLSRLSRIIGKRKRYSLRAEKTSEDELGDLVDNFNEMLLAIQKRDEALANKSLELEYSNKELEQFAYVISHDLKSPLVTIQGFASRFIKSMEDSNLERAEDSARRVQKAAKRMGELIDDVLALSRIGRRQTGKKVVDLNDELSQVKDDLQAALEQAQAHLKVENRLPTVYADAGEIRQVFLNLVSNALKYACTEPGRGITVGSREMEDETRVFVRDQGPGIPSPYQDKVFQLFQRLSQDKQGTGLGLAIVSKVMKNLSGRAWVESAPNQGATFWLAFPHRKGSES